MCALSLVLLLLVLLVLLLLLSEMAVLAVIDSRSILIGHSLENGDPDQRDDMQVAPDRVDHLFACAADLRALKLAHTRVIDTSVCVCTCV